MGRMHAPGKGISQSALPYRRSVPTWLKLSPDDVKEQIYKLGKKGLTPSQIESKHEKILLDRNVCQDSMKRAVEEAVNANSGRHDLPVGFHGTWQKRGHTSLSGIVSATSVDTGKVTGVILRDSHGVAQVRFVTGNKILRIMKAMGLAPDLPEDLYFLIKKAVAIRKHLERNRKDKDSKFRLILVESRIHRLARYYKTKGGLPPNWKYESSTASALVA